MALTTVPRVKSFLGLKADDTQHDALLSELVERVSKRLSERCQRVFEYQAAIIEYHDGTGVSGALALRQYPVDSAVAVTLYDDTERAYGSDTLVDAADYGLDHPNGLLVLDGFTFHKGFQNVKVTYAAGYKVIPQDLEDAAILYVCAEFLDTQSEVRASIEVETTTRVDRQREYADKALDRYRRPIL